MAAVGDAVDACSDCEAGNETTRSEGSQTRSSRIHEDWFRRFIDTDRLGLTRCLAGQAEEVRLVHD